MLPNGLAVAVKVLHGDFNQRSEEHFMAEMGAIGRTHHINLVRLFGFCFDASTRVLVYEHFMTVQWEAVPIVRRAGQKGVVIHSNTTHGRLTGSTYDQHERRAGNEAVKKRALRGGAGPRVQSLAATKHYAVVPDRVMRHATIEKFFSEMANEKPIRFTPAQLQGYTNNYSSRLGAGGFGTVYKGMLPNGLAVAVKVLHGDLNQRSEEQFMAEMGTIGRTHHINLVRLFGFCFDASVRALVYDFMQHGALDSYLFNGAADVGMAKVADFGLARLVDRADTHVSMSGVRGTPGYAAPELWMGSAVTEKCDVYSFGMLLLEAVGRRRNFDEAALESQQWFPKLAWTKYESGELVELVMPSSGNDNGVDAVDEELCKELAERMCKVAFWCVQQQPGARPPMGAVVKMLEGEMDIALPPNPFRHLMEDVPLNNLWATMTSSVNTASASAEDGISRGSNEIVSL
ncbi:hypothetical protein ZWY2020_012789 [Hordeum vulgare]|nr:hypothetical protein ZWY2020_012789 [Hordeum vulgare]